MSTKMGKAGKATHGVNQFGRDSIEASMHEPIDKILVSVRAWCNGEQTSCGTIQWPELSINGDTYNLV
jgi:hypothetical protein